MGILVFCTCLWWCWKVTEFLGASRPLGCPPWGRLGREGRLGIVIQPVKPSAPPHGALAGPPGSEHQVETVMSCKPAAPVRQFTVCSTEAARRRTSCRSWIFVSSTCCMWSISCCLSWHRLCSSASLWLVKLSAVVLFNMENGKLVKSYIQFTQV